MFSAQPPVRDGWEAVLYEYAPKNLKKVYICVVKNLKKV